MIVPIVQGQNDVAGHREKRGLEDLSALAQKAEATMSTAKATVSGLIRASSSSMSRAQRRDVDESPAELEATSSPSRVSRR